jgi:hypothetical protein
MRRFVPNRKPEVVHEPLRQIYYYSKNLVRSNVQPVVIRTRSTRVIHSVAHIICVLQYVLRLPVLLGTFLCVVVPVVHTGGKKKVSKGTSTSPQTTWLVSDVVVTVYHNVGR